MCQDVMISKVQSTKSTLSYNFLVVHVHSGILSLLQCLYTYFTIAFSQKMVKKIVQPFILVKHHMSRVVVFSASQLPSTLNVTSFKTLQIHAFMISLILVVYLSVSINAPYLLHYSRISCSSGFLYLNSFIFSINIWF